MSRRSMIAGMRLTRTRLAQSGPTHSPPQHRPMPDQEAKDG